jgi:hypothetical protein
VKLGNEIDADDRTVGDLDDDEVDWDVDGTFASLDELITVLRAIRGRVYRAFFALGNLSQQVVEGLRRAGSAENRVNLILDELSLEIGPVEVGDLELPKVFQVGWIAVSLSGNGSLRPWTFRDLIARAEACPPVVGLADLCRRAWPVTPKRPGMLQRLRRKRLRHLWPYDAIDRAMDWCWGLHETE